MNERKNLELYVHIPFCVRKCAYCDFLSFAADEAAREQYVQTLRTEILRTAERDRTQYRVSSVFFGGGTPSLLTGRQIEVLMDAIYSGYAMEPEAEISAEANPGTLSAEKLKIWKQAGINRLSIGCQSTDERELQLLGRIHSRADFLDNYRMAREIGFANINVDLMSALPGQTPEDWIRNLEEVAKLHPEHISAYSLILEPETPLYRAYADGIGLPGEEEERQMYADTKTVLAAYGYARYEISNYAREGYRCRHNVGYWTGVSYRGFGLGASSYMEEIRYKNTADMRLYLQGINSGSGKSDDLREVEHLTREDRMAEFVILGLRMAEGISEQTFAERFSVRFDDVYQEVFEKYRRLGLLDRQQGRIFLTDDGISVSNTVMADFLLSD